MIPLESSAKVSTFFVYSDDMPVAPSWTFSMFDLFHHIIGHDDCPARGGAVPVRYGTGGLVQARNEAVELFLKTDSEWLFWIDTDMGFEPDSIDRLLTSANPDTRPVMGGLCFVRREIGRDGMNGYLTVPRPTIYLWSQTPSGTTGFVPMDNYQRGEIVECSATGSAFLLIHRSVFEKIGGNWYGLIANPDGGAFSEDLSFCLRLAQHGIPVHVDTNVKTTHYKVSWMGEAEYGTYLAAEEHVRSFGGEFSQFAPVSNRAQRRAAKRGAA